MNKLFRAQMYILLRSHFTWFSAAALILMMAISFLFGYYVLPSSGVDIESFSDGLSFPNVLFSLLFGLAKNYGIVIALFYASMASGTEYAWGTIRLPLLLAYPRWKVALSKWLALSLNLAFALLLSCFLGGIFGHMGARHLGFTVNSLATNDIFVAGRSYLLLVIGVAAYTALVVFLATLMRSPILVFATGLLIYMIEIFLVDVIAFTPPFWFTEYLLYFNLSSLTTNLALQSGTHPLFSWSSLLLVTGYCILFLLGLTFIFNRQNISE